MTRVHFLVECSRLGNMRQGFIRSLKDTLITKTQRLTTPGVLGILGEGLFIFREQGSTANYFRGAGEQAHTFGDLGSTAKK